MLLLFQDFIQNTARLSNARIEWYVIFVVKKQLHLTKLSLCQLRLAWQSACAARTRQMRLANNKARSQGALCRPASFLFLQPASAPLRKGSLDLRRPTSHETANPTCEKKSSSNNHPISVSCTSPVRPRSTASERWKLPSKGIRQARPPTVNHATDQLFTISRLTTSHDFRCLMLLFPQMQGFRVGRP